ncbi:MAG TPA: SpoIIE family protein phosphatase [Candidatus Polarisedimenticolia bacterium]|jgi:sigma-B regulation protein RsbU (phosphoserine phosphatase)|nr:SpoIIE family protein phosphatase [Candidatus Polarisedimenticolia bacterium]
MAVVATSHTGEAALLIEVGGRQRRLDITKSPLTIGRAEECDATIADLKVSRQHAKLEIEGGDYYIVDCQSRHGTFVNGSRCDRTKLKNKDEITFGVAGVKIIFTQGSDAAHTTHNTTNELLSRLVSKSDTSDLEKLRLFLEAARSLTGGVVVNEVLSNMLDYALKITKAERGFVYLKDSDKGGTPVLACGLDSKGGSLTTDPKVSHSVVQEALTSASEFITGDALKQQALAERHSIVLNELRTVIAIPLRTRRQHGNSPTDVDGVLYLDSRSVSLNLSGVSHEVLRALASECAAVLESAKLVAAEQAAQQYRKEMEIAASIQRSLISTSKVETDFVRVNGFSIPCREVGGDFFDVHVAPDSVTVIVADVSGKGISAALLASVIHGMFYAQMTSGARLVDAVASINRFLCSRVAGQKYATLLAAQLHRDGKLALVNCGHVPAILAQDGKVTHVEDGDMPVGLISEVDFHVIERELPAGSRLCILTDGISETENAEGAEFGTHLIANFLCNEDPIREILDAVQSFGGNSEAQDDRTLVVLERIK